MSRSHHNKNLDKFKKLYTIGKGAYGIVYKAQDQETNALVALKVLSQNTDNNGIHPQSLREISILRKLNHPNVLQLKEVYINEYELVLVLDLMACDLATLIKSSSYFADLPFIKKIMRDFLNGLCYCHINRVVHRDLKPQNLLLDQTQNLKIADFGLSRVYQIPKRPYTDSVQTLWYRAPEVLFEDLEYSAAVDMWSVGCIMAEIMTGIALFQSKTPLDQIACIFRIMGTPNEHTWPGVTTMKGYPEDIPIWQPVPLEQIFNTFPPECIDLLKSFLQLRPENRISARDALEHPFIVNN